MKKIIWSGYEWITQERWGQFHPEKPFVYYDDSCVEINEDFSISLYTKRNPKEFFGKIVEFGIGLISNTTKFSHGYFEIEAKLPTGKYLWPAFWMWSFDNWPPEIDVFEGYSNFFGNYINIFNDIKFWNIYNIQTNLYFENLNGFNRINSIKSKKHYISIFKKPPNKRFIKYGVDWQKDYIKFYYDNKLVRTITEKHILYQLNETTMNVIINNSLYKPTENPESEFIIKYFRYSEKKN